MAALFLIAVVALFTSSPVIADQTNPFSVDRSDVQTYIVHVEKLNSPLSSEENRNDYYRSFLPSSVETTEDTDVMVHTYHRILSGFAARLTDEEVKGMQEKDGFLFASPQRILQLHTTHTPNFLGLHPETGFWKGSNFGKGVIIGMLDTGIFPNHPSFNDEGMPPPPAKWKGVCEFNASDCNNKLIGARNMVSSASSSTTAEPPLDAEGHGTHTASTSAGSFVKNAEVLGEAFGTASGMAPMAHLAMYKVCTEKDCAESDLLAGMDAAVADGVDVISMSIGGPATPFYHDNIAIGSFGAVREGIFVSCSAGNAGPTNSTLANEAPWILTVGASTMDRTILATVKLGGGSNGGTGDSFIGESLFQPKDYPSTLMPLVYAGASGNTTSTFCGAGALDGFDVKGKVVLCERGGNVSRIAKGIEVKNAGGAAMILMNAELDASSTLADAHVLPASHVSFADGQKIKSYMRSTSSPTATIMFNGTVIGSSSSPIVTSFSSRGPSVITPGILKPDIIGPGVSVLAAWPFALDNYTSKSTFNIISGTSMSCPHLGGIAALLKSAYPDWSPAAIKSAIMTTADLENLGGKPILNEKLEPADFFATGAGHVNPSKASNPGLVYDIQFTDYVNYLCGLYTDNEVSIIAQQSTLCEGSGISEGELNYPSFSVKLGDQVQTFNRTVTNVGEANSTYKVSIFIPTGVQVVVEPIELVFSELNQKLTYSVMFEKISAEVGTHTPFSQGYLKWESSTHSVRSPISVTFA